MDNPLGNPGAGGGMAGSPGFNGGPISTEQFTEALQIMHQYDARISPQERHAAERYLVALRDSPEGLNLAFHVVSNEEVHEIRCFWAFNTIMHHFPSIAASMDAQQALEIYTTLFSWLYRYLFNPSPSSVGSSGCDGSAPGANSGNASSLSMGGMSLGIPNGSNSGGGSAASTSGATEFLLNKHAQMMVAGIEECYPQRWPTVFDDVFQLLARSEGLPRARDLATLYFLRIFEYIDERVVSVRGRTDRAREQRQRDMEVKDAMRESIIETAAQTWHNILCEYRAKNPTIARLCLTVVQTYIEWIDIALVVRPNWINLLYFLTTIPQLRVGACECLRGIVEKKQVPPVKLETLQALGIVEVLPRIVNMISFQTLFQSGNATAGSDSGAPIQNPSSSPFGQTHASLRNAARPADPSGADLATWLSSSTVGLPPFLAGDNTAAASSENASAEDDEAFAEVVANLAVSLALQLLALRDAGPPIPLDDALHAVVFQVLHEFRMSDNTMDDTILPFALQYVKSNAMLDSEAETLLDTVYKHTILVNTDEDIWSDEVIESRKALHNVCRLLFRRNPSLVLQHLGRVVRSVALSPTPAPASESEAALRYLYELGESVKMEWLRDANNDFSQLLHTILQSETLLTHPSCTVHLNYFEVLDRYSAFFVYHQSQVPLLLNHLLLMPCGITNPNDRVRSRICYLFSHLAQTLKVQFTPHAADVMTAMRSILESYDGVCLAPPDRRDLFEATGMLLGLLYPDTSNCHGLVSAVLQHMSALVQAGVNGSSASSMGVKSGTAVNGFQGASTSAHSPSDMEVAACLIADDMSYLSHLCKGLRNGCASPSVSAGGKQQQQSGTPMFGVTPERAKLSDQVVGDAQSAGTNAASNGGRSVSGGGSATGTVASERYGLLFRDVCATVMRVLERWSSYAVVRDRAGQFMHQIIKILLTEDIVEVFEEYTYKSVQWMEAVPELTKLLRLVLQFTNQTKSAGVSTIARLLPPIINKTAQVGDLASVSAVMGVISEQTREQVDVFRQYLYWIHAIAHSSAHVALLTPPANDVLLTILRQLLDAVGVSAEFELPRQSLQILTRLCQLWCGADSVGDAVDGGEGKSTPRDHPLLSRSLNSPHATQQLRAQFGDQMRAFEAFMGDTVVGYVLELFTRPGAFDLNDAKSMGVVSEYCNLLKAFIGRLPEAQGIGRLYSLLQQLVGDSAAHEMCIRLRDASRIDMALKQHFRTLLLRAQNVRGGGTGVES